MFQPSRARHFLRYTVKLWTHAPRTPPQDHTAPSPSPSSEEPLPLQDILYSPLADPDPSASPSTSHPSPPRHGGGFPKEFIQSMVRQAIEEPLGAERMEMEKKEQKRRAGVSTEPSPGITTSDTNPFELCYTTQIVDRHGMPVRERSGHNDPPKTFPELLALCPPTLRSQLESFLLFKNKNRNASLPFHHLSPVQQASYRYIMEERDVLCIAPTAVGKTLAYVLPILLKLTHTAMGSMGGGEDGAPLTRSTIEKALQNHTVEICPYCELDMREARMCPLTGLPHDLRGEKDEDEALSSHKKQHMTNLSEALPYVVAPKALILVPTSQLVHQVHQVMKALNGGLSVQYLVRAKTEEEQQRFFRIFGKNDKGVDILCTTPETVLPALYKRKMTLKQLQILVLDEVDDLVSTNHFEAVKIILGFIPKASANPLHPGGGGRSSTGLMKRPQRLLFGASLPPVAYQMLRETFLLPSHRFILSDVRKDHLGHPLTPSNNNIAATVATQGIASLNPVLKHQVFMLGRVEKIHKLVDLFQTGRINDKVIIFCNSRNNVGYVKTKLEEMLNYSTEEEEGRPRRNNPRRPSSSFSSVSPQKKYNITTLTSHSSSTARQGVLKLFSKGLSTILISTDLLSRGIDFQNVPYVVNYDMPLDMETYVHRAGRCGRGEGGLHYHIRGQQRKEQKLALEEKATNVTDPTEYRTTESLFDEEVETPVEQDKPEEKENQGVEEETDDALPSPLPTTPTYTQGYVFTFFQPENLKIAKPFVAYLRAHRQLVPPTLVEMAKYSFTDVLSKHAPLQHAPTRPYRRDDPQRSTSVFSSSVVNQKGGRYGQYRPQGLPSAHRL